MFLAPPELWAGNFPIFPTRGHGLGFLYGWQRKAFRQQTGWLWAEGQGEKSSRTESKALTSFSGTTSDRADSSRPLSNHRSSPAGPSPERAGFPVIVECLLGERGLVSGTTVSN